MGVTPGTRCGRPRQAESLQRYPQKVSFAHPRGDETMRHEGVIEIADLPPARDQADVERPARQSRRRRQADPAVAASSVLRVDIVICLRRRGDVQQRHAADGPGPGCQKVKALDEAENFVRTHYLFTKAKSSPISAWLL